MGLQPAHAHSTSNLYGFLDLGYFMLQNDAKLNFLSQTVLELERVL